MPVSNPVSYVSRAPSGIGYIIARPRLWRNEGKEWDEGKTAAFEKASQNFKINTDVKLDCIQSGESFYRSARKETEGVAFATLRLTDTAGR